MARQRIHNRRAGRGSTGSASWISYSDMMAALILIFVLILTYSLYQYFIMLKTKTDELDAQKEQLVLIQSALDDKENALIIIQADLDSKEKELDDQKQQLILMQETLDDKEKTLIIIQADLDAKQVELDAARARLEDQQLLLTSQARRIDDLIGIRTTMIRDLSSSLARASLKATVDPNNGDIMLDSSVFFETGKSTIKQEGQELLNRFIPVYLDVLLRDEYADYLGEIIIEGHTDSQPVIRKITESRLAVGMILILAGALLAFNPYILKDLFPVVWGISLLFGGFLKIQYGFDQLTLKLRKWWIMLILAVFSLLIGTLALTRPAFLGEKQEIVIGIFLILEAVLDVVVFILINRALKKHTDGIRPHKTQAEGTAGETGTEAEVLPQEPEEKKAQPDKTAEEDE